MLTDLPIYKHPIRPGTDEKMIREFMASPEFFTCEFYNCRMSREACGRRRAAAMEAETEDKKTVFSKCIECQQAERGKIMDPKKCPVDGCGKPVKARGMCMTHYYREYSKGKFNSKIIAPAPPADQGSTDKVSTKPADPPKAPEPEKQTDPPKDPESKTAQASPATPAPPKKPENMHANMQAEKKPNGTKRVNVQFSGPDVAIWERLRDSAKRNRRDIRTEALYIIESWLREPEVSHD